MSADHDRPAGSSSVVAANGSSIRAADPSEVAVVEHLVRSCGLPVGGVAELVAHGSFLVAPDGAGVAGAVGLERLGHQVLLRSLAVDPRYRRRGLGRRLVEAATARVRAEDVELWLLTESAEAFLAGCGFVPVDRSSVAGPVTESYEWCEACPATAVAMRWPVVETGSS